MLQRRAEDGGGDDERRGRRGSRRPRVPRPPEALHRLQLREVHRNRGRCGGVSTRVCRRLPVCFLFFPKVPSFLGRNLAGCSLFSASITSSNGGCWIVIGLSILRLPDLRDSKLKYLMISNLGFTQHTWSQGTIYEKLHLEYQKFSLTCRLSSM